MKFRIVLLAAGLIGIVAVYRLLIPPPSYTLRPNDPVQLVFAPNVEHPFFLTRSGKLFQPMETGWMHMAVDTPLKDVYIEYNGDIYAGTDEGLLRYQDTRWETVPGVPPTDDIEAMHGFLFAMGKEGVARSNEGSSDWRTLKMPLPDVPASGLVMLGDHTHIMHNGSLIQTNDMGLSWTILPPPGEIRTLSTDALDNLLVVVEDGLYRWQYQAKTWSKIAPLPENLPVERLALFNGEIYALAQGRLFKLENGKWGAVSIDGAGYLTAIAGHRQNRLWLADAANNNLLYTDTGTAWTRIPIKNS